jgi:hypothetical protein
VDAGMNSGNSKEADLSKSVWSDADFKEMGRHDATRARSCA